MFDSKLSRGNTTVHGSANLSTSMSGNAIGSLEIDRSSTKSSTRQGEKEMEKHTIKGTDSTKVVVKGTLVISLVLAITFLTAGLVVATHG